MSSVTASIEPVVITVPVSSGNDIVLSAVGSTTTNDVSKSSAVAPSNIKVFAVSNTIDEPKSVKPVDDVILFEPKLIVVTRQQVSY